MHRLLLTFLLGLALGLDPVASFHARAQEPAPPTPPTPPSEVFRGGDPDTNSAAPERPKNRIRRGGGQGSGEIVELGHDVVIREGESKRNIVVIGGNARIEGRVEHDLVVISGSAEITGSVGGNVVVVLGGIKLGPDASIRRDAVVFGGPFECDDSAHIGGQRIFMGVTQVIPGFGWFQQWFSNGLMLARPLPPRVAWVWVMAGIFLFFYLMLTVVFPAPVRASAVALRERPVGSFFAGILLCILFGPLMFILAISVVGLVAIPFVLCAAVLAFFFGKAAVYACAGQQILRPFSGTEAKLPLGLLAGAGLCYLLYMVPILGFVLWGMVTLLGFGAVLLASFRSFRREEAPAGVAAPPVVVTTPAVIGSTTPPTLGVAALPPGEVLVLPRVGFWRRTLATLLDFILLSWILPFSGPLFLAVWTAYFIAMWAWKGTTIGGIVLGLKIVRLDGSPIDFSVALVRSLSSYFSGIALGLGFFWAGWDRDKQAWHDKIAGTVVVHMPKGVSLV